MIGWSDAKPNSRVRVPKSTALWLRSGQAGIIPQKKTRDGAAVAVPQMRLRGLRGFVAEDYAGNQVAEQDKQNYDHGCLKLVVLQIRKRVIAEADRQIADAEVADDAGQRDG